MKTRHFLHTDTLYIEFREATVVETRDLDENTQIDLDADGNLCSLTIEHASDRVDLPKIEYKRN